MAWHYQRNHALLQRFFIWATIETRLITETTQEKLLTPRVQLHVSHSGTECENVNVTKTCYPVTYTAVINIKVYISKLSNMYHFSMCVFNTYTCLTVSIVHVIVFIKLLKANCVLLLTVQLSPKFLRFSIVILIATTVIFTILTTKKETHIRILLLKYKSILRYQSKG